MFTPKSNILKAIFSGTSSVSYGPFKLENPTGDFSEARLSVNGTEIDVTATTKKFMALLISRQGQDLTLRTYVDAMDTQSCADISAQIREGSMPSRLGALKRGKINQSAHMNSVRETISLTFGKSAEGVQYLDMLETVPGRGDTEILRRVRSGYRLNIGTQDAAP